MSLMKRRPRAEASYCEDAPSPAFKRLRLDSDPQDQQQPPGKGPLSQQPCGVADDDAAAAALARALCGGVGADYASINALLKQLHDERLRRAAMAGASRTDEAPGTAQPR